MGREKSKFIVKGNARPSQQSAGFAPRAKPTVGRVTADRHNSAFLVEESKIIMKGKSNARDNRYS